MTVSQSPHTLAEGQTIQWYRVERVLGRGGFGVTYLATDNNLNHRVAIKEYLPATLVQRAEDKSLQPVSTEADKQFRDGLQRFLGEAQTLVKFRHPNIVRVMAVFEENNTAYLVMEYEEGEQFKEAVKRVGGSDESELKRLLLAVIDGLEQVHAHGFIHRDIKPVNLIIRNDGSPVLLDFGAARVADPEQVTRHTSYVSTGYTALEQYQEGEGLTVGPWTDIYALAATLYYAISGQTPVSAVGRLAALVKNSADPLVAATEVGHGRYSEEFLEAIDWALQFKVEERPQNLHQWRQSIARTQVVPLDTLSGTNLKTRVHNKSLHTPRAPVKKSRKQSWIWLAMCLLLALVGAFIGFDYLSRQAQQRDFAELLESADNAFDSGGDFDVTRSLYLQVLEKDPQNSHAQTKLSNNNRRLENDISTSIAERNFDNANSLLKKYRQVEPDRSAALETRLSAEQQLAEFDKRFAAAELRVQQNDFTAALVQLNKLRLDGADSGRVEALERRARAANNQNKKEQRKLESEREARKQRKVEAQRRLSEATERQRQRRADFRDYIQQAQSALQSDDLSGARKWFDSASSLQIEDDDLSELETRLRAAEALSQTPLSSYEVRYARGQFYALKRALELKNIAAVRELISPDSKKIRLFETLFRRYTQITVRVLNVTPALSPKRVTATLRIEKMALPNGDIVYPSDSYQDSLLTISRQRYSWSAIQW